VAGITLYLEVRESDGLDDSADDQVTGYSRSFAWNVSTDEEAAGFGDSELDNGNATDIEQAKRDCWRAAVAYLREDSYSDEEIVDSI